MSGCFGFGVSVDDVQAVLQRMGRSGNTDDAEEAMSTLDMTAIEKAALKASTDLDEQTDAALNEIERQLTIAGA